MISQKLNTLVYSRAYSVVASDHEPKDLVYNGRGEKFGAPSFLLGMFFFPVHDIVDGRTFLYLPGA